MAETPSLAPALNSPPARWMLPVVLGLHLLLASYYAVALPLWGAVPDEPLHYSDIKFVAENWRLPVINDPFRDLKEYYFVADPAGAAQHGPTYYWSAAVIYKLAEGFSLTRQQYVLRFYSVLLGLLTVFLAYKAFQLLFPADPFLVLACTLLVTLMPHRLLMSAVMYADVMAILGTTVALHAIIWCVQTRQGAAGWLVAGLAFGFDVLTKTSAIVVVPGLAVTVALLWRGHEWSARQTAANVGAFAAGTLVLSGWWLWRSVHLYGELFPTEPMPPGYGWGDVIFDPSFPWVLWMAIRGYWLSLWSQVGWLPQWAVLPMYGLLLLGTAATLYGMLATLVRRHTGGSTAYWALLWGFAVSGLTIFYAGLQRTILVSFHSNEQTGKHGQTVLVAFVALAVAGWEYLVGMRRAVGVVMAGAVLMALFNGLSVYNLQTNLIPRFAPTPPPLADCPVRDLPHGGMSWVKPWPNRLNRYLKENRAKASPAPTGPPTSLRLTPGEVEHAPTGRVARVQHFEDVPGRDDVHHQQRHEPAHEHRLCALPQQVVYPHQ